jgi:hypothetical protein
LRQRLESFLKLGVVFAAVVAMMDYFLASFPILLYIGLTVAFIFFAVLIFDQIIPFLSKAPANRPEAIERHDDELVWLEHLAHKAIEQREPKSAELLATRLRAIVLAMAAYRTNISEARLEEIATENPKSLSELIRDEDMTQVIVGNVSQVIGKEPQAIQALLSKIESWSI